MIDHKLVKLGKKAPKIDERTLKLAKYLSPALPPPPPSCNWTKGVGSWGMMLNDSLGDCTCAAVGHGIQVATLNSIGEITPPDSLILSLYENACGYVPGDLSTDQGGVIVDVLNYVRKNKPGEKLHHHKQKFQLYAYADPDITNTTHVKQAIQLFGVVDIGLQLPISAQTQVGSVWDVVGNPNTNADSQAGSWGGHSVAIVAYDAETVTCITWGALQQMTWNFWNTYVDEAYALLFNSWVKQYGAQYSEMLAQLDADLVLVTN